MTTTTSTTKPDMTKKITSSLFPSDDEIPLLVSSSTPELSPYDDAHHGFYNPHDEYTSRFYDDDTMNQSNFSSLLEIQHDHIDTMFDVASFPHTTSANIQSMRNRHYARPSLSSSIRIDKNSKCKDDNNYYVSITNTLKIILTWALAVVFTMCVWLSFAMDWYTSYIVIDIMSSNTTASLLPTATTSIPIYQQSYGLLYLLLPESVPCLLCNVVLWATAVIVPCIIMVLLPVELYIICKQYHLPESSDRQQDEALVVLSVNNNHNDDDRSSSFNLQPKLFAICHEMVRSQYTIIFFIALFMIPELPSQQLALQMNSPSTSATTTVNVELSFDANLQNGFILYCTGVICSTICIVILRYNTNCHRTSLNHDRHLTRDKYSTPTLQDFDCSTNDVVPGNQQHSLVSLTSISERHGDINLNKNDPRHHHYPSIQILEEQLHQTNHEEEKALEKDYTIVTTPLLQRSERMDLLKPIYRTKKPQADCSCICWKTILIFQCGLICILLVAPGFFLPFMTMHFEQKHLPDPTSSNGRIINNNIYQQKHLIPDSATRVFSLFEIFCSVLHHETHQSCMYGLPIVLFLMIVFFPLCAIILMIAVWTKTPTQQIVDEYHHRKHDVLFTSKNYKYQYRDLLYAIHPLVGSVIVSISLLMGAHIIQNWNFLSFINEKDESTRGAISSSMIRYLISHTWVGGRICRVSIHIGGWCYILHSLLLELLIAETLLCS